MTDTNFAQITDRLKRILGVTSDAALARAIGMGPTAFNNRKKDGSLPYGAIVELCVRDGLSLDHVFDSSGEGAGSGMLLTPEEKRLLESFGNLGKDDKKAVLKHSKCLGR